MGGAAVATTKHPCSHTVRGDRASEVRTNTNDTQFIGFARGVRYVRGLGYRNNNQKLGSFGEARWAVGNGSPRLQLQTTQTAHTANNADKCWRDRVRGSVGRIETTNTEANGMRTTNSRPCRRPQSGSSGYSKPPAGNCL